MRETTTNGGRLKRSVEGDAEASSHRRIATMLAQGVGLSDHDGRTEVEVKMLDQVLLDIEIHCRRSFAACRRSLVGEANILAVLKVDGSKVFGEQTMNSDRIMFREIGLGSAKVRFSATC
jgi:hypothetical protein